MSMKRTALACLLLAGVIAIPFGVMRAQSQETVRRGELEAQEFGTHFSDDDWLDRLKEFRSQQLEGSWAVTVTPVLPPGAPPVPPFRAYGSFARGGATFGSDRNRPLSKRHGNWAHLGGNDFAWTTIEDLFDATGSFVGTAKVRVKASITGKNEFVGVSNGEFRDAAGNVTSSSCGTIRGERISIEPLSLQCQSITPPQ